MAIEIEGYRDGDRDEGYRDGDRDEGISRR
jgi:hypothetical protein